jgi:DNA-binding NarL/FixJ family response regulator
MKLCHEINILMIDDDENDAMLVRHMISKMPDFRWHFHWSGSYDEGLRKLAELQWDICLVDYQLGAHTGVQVVTEARARGVDCPFLLLTGAGSRSIDLQAMRAGVKGYLEKSRLCPLELERAVRYAISQTPSEESSILALSHVPPAAEKMIRRGFASKQPFVVVALMLDRESAMRNHLGATQIDVINADLESLIRARLCSDEVLFRTVEGVFLLVTSKQDSREARQFLSLLLSEPLALSKDGRNRTISLPAITRRNVFSSAGLPGPVSLITDLDAFIGPYPTDRPAQVPGRSEFAPGHPASSLVEGTAITGLR